MKKKIMLVDVLEQPRYMLERIDIIPDLIPLDMIFPNFNSCLLSLKQNLQDLI